MRAIISTATSPTATARKGLGYYDYGFGNYIVLRETLWQATGGKVDLFVDPKVRQVATYGPRLEIENGVWPCHRGLSVRDARWTTGYWAIAAAPSAWV